MGEELSRKDLQVISRTFQRVSGQAWGLAVGLLSALVLFLATAILLVLGGPNPGPHLSLLGAYFPGYSVTWFGAFLGSVYAFLLGYGAGRMIGALYNRIVDRL
jgi:uncharacterized membrane protein YdjX (TVP38/TMEM64 family)